MNCNILLLARIFRIIKADGTVDDFLGNAGDEFLVNSEAASSQVEPTVTGLSDGGFVVSWRTDDSAQDGSGSAIKARIFSPVNEVPVITSDGGGDEATIVVAEGTMAVTEVMANDQDAGTTPSYAIDGGDDAALFEIDGVTGELAFIAALDFETPADLDGNNVYDVTVVASDGITDFSGFGLEGDRLDLKAALPGKFVFLGTEAFSGAVGELRY